MTKPNSFLVVEDDRAFLEKLDTSLTKDFGFAVDSAQSSPKHTTYVNGKITAHVTSDFDTAAGIIQTTPLMAVFLDGDLGDRRAPRAGFQLFDIARKLPEPPMAISISNALALYNHMCSFGFTANSDKGGHIGKSHRRVGQTIEALVAHAAKATTETTAARPAGAPAFSTLSNAKPA